ncbi:MAG: preprotein translocase subunit YajC [Planctomycetota bacterium]
MPAELIAGGQSLLASGVGVLAQDPQPSPFSSLAPAMLAIMLLAYFMFIRPQQQKERRFQEMLANLKENDHVVTVGGIHGVVTGVHKDAERVTLRIDEASGAKIKVGLWAISRVEGDEDDKPAPKAPAAKQPAAKSAAGGKQNK